MDDFQHRIGDKIKVYPSLLQGSAILGNSPETFLEVGRSVVGVVYFEHGDSWGGCFPTPIAGRTRVRLAVKDSFGKTHKRSFWVPVVSLSQARQYNPSFGSTFATVHGDSSQPEQVDA
jgi:hypothetical protein